RLDTSVLANDSYVLRLFATDVGGHERTLDRVLSVAGELKLGNFRLSFTDLSLPVSGIPITVSRTYDTLNAAQSEDFGHGWRLEFRNTDLRTSVEKTGLEEDGIYNPFRVGTRVYVTLPGGRREGFTFRPQLAPGLRGSFLGLYRPAFVPDAGVTSQLTVETFDLFRSGDTFYLGTPYNPIASEYGGGFTLTTKDSIAYEIDGTTGDLDRVTDPNGNTLTFTDTGIVS